MVAQDPTVVPVAGDDRTAARDGGGTAAGRRRGATGLDRSSAVPLYLQLEADLRGRIARGEWAPGQRIASENELDREYGLSRMTVRGVLTTLVGEGLLYRVPGKGTFVAPEKIEAMSPAYLGIREQLEAQGYSTTTRLVRADRQQPSAAVAKTLDMSAVDEVYAIERVRSVDGVPVSLHRSWIPAALAPGLDNQDLVGNQLCVVLEQEYGLVMSRVEEQLESIRMVAADARMLGVYTGSPGLMLTDRIMDAAQRSFEASSIIFRGDKIRLRFSYHL